MSVHESIGDTKHNTNNVKTDVKAYIRTLEATKNLVHTFIDSLTHAVE